MTQYVHSRKKNPLLREWRQLKLWWKRLPVRNGWLALALLHLVVLMTGLESAYVQAVTTYDELSPQLLRMQSFLLLLSLDILVPFIVVLLSRRVFFFFLLGQWVLSIVLLHYTIFFYNPLTLSTIYHSLQGAASLGVEIVAFARPLTIAVLTALFLIKVILIQMSRLPDYRMPKVWKLRGISAVVWMAVVWIISSMIYGKTGLTVLWVDPQGHRTATERRMEEGTREAVRHIGYVATWIGEWFSGTYKDTDLIYAEARCDDPGAWPCTQNEDICAPDNWQGIPLPPLGPTVIMLQVESLDFETLGMMVNGYPVTPFLNFLARDSVVLKAFAPHKVGSSNSDYELLNGRVADQNVIYYSYILDYPDSIMHLLREKQYETSIFHGLNGNLFNLRYAYTHQGIEHLYFKEELVRAGYRPSRYIMNHILDEDLFAYAAEHLDPKLRQVQFLITMTTHIPFIEPLPQFKSAGGTFARYISSLNYLDQCLTAFYAQLPQDTLIIIWGDHGSDVAYPRGFMPNERHIPFMVHVKGNSTWMTGSEQGQEALGGLSGAGLTGIEEGEDMNPMFFSPTEMLMAWNEEMGFPRLAAKQVYTLCELYYFLRKIFAQEIHPA